jgi:hypothetical protein
VVQSLTALPQGGEQRRDVHPAIGSSDRVDLLDAGQSAIVVPPRAVEVIARIGHIAQILLDERDSVIAAKGRVLIACLIVETVGVSQLITLPADGGEITDHICGPPSFASGFVEIECATVCLLGTFQPAVRECCVATFKKLIGCSTVGVSFHFITARCPAERR